MTQITASLVKELRDKTGAGMMDCKSALQETAGDIEQAVDWLRKKGLSKAAKKAGRVAAEGLVAVAVQGNEGVVVSEVEEGSTAANVGFQKGDLIMALNGERMTNSREVETALKDRKRAWEVTISRGGQTITSVFPG